MYSAPVHSYPTYGQQYYQGPAPLRRAYPRQHRDVMRLRVQPYNDYARHQWMPLKRSQQTTSSNSIIVQDFKPHHASYRGHPEIFESRLPRYNNENVAPAMKPEPTAKKPLDVLALLKQLQNNGILSNDTSSAASSAKKPWTPTVLFDRTLLRRSQSAIDALLAPRAEVCKECGLRCDDETSLKEHRNNHVKERLGLLQKSDSTSWYQTKENWLADDENLKASSSDSDDMKSTLENIENIGEENADVVWNNGINSECLVCREKFDCYFDDENDNWKLRNSVLYGQKALHAGCIHDLSMDFENLSCDSQL